MKRVYFVDTVHPILADRLIEAGYSCIDVSTQSHSDLKTTLSDAYGIVVRSRFAMNEDLLAGAPLLKFIARSGAGMENIDVKWCEQSGIVLHNAPEGNRNAVAEQALGMLLALMNKLHTADREVRNGLWEREANRGYELEGKTVGILGYGNNGAAFARKLQGFDVKVLAYDKFKSGFENAFVREVTMQDIFNHADVLSLHIPQDESTLRLINADFINKMQKPFWLLNLSRGKIVCTQDVLNAIDARKIMGAALDVLEFESSSFEQWLNPANATPVLQRLLKHPKVMLTPHVGGWTHESYFKLSNVLANKILATD